VLERSAALLGELLLHPATKNGRLIQSYVKGEQENLIRLIQSSRNDKQQYAMERLIEEMFNGEDYAVSRFGTVARAQQITARKLFDQYQTLTVSAPIELYYCGSAPMRRVEMAWREALMGLPRGAQRFEIGTDSRRPSETEVRTFAEHLDVTQGKLEMGFRVGFGLSDPQYPAMLVTNAMFGGSATSRLFQRVREELSLCYYASSTLVSLKGLVLVACGVDAQRFDQVQSEILRQLEQLQRGEFTHQEFESAKRSVVHALRCVQDDQGQLCSRWLMDRAAGEIFDLERLITRVEDVTEGSAAAAAMEMRLDSVYTLSAPEKGEDDCEGA
jgi:predicted Zn-dependent peptidase